MTSEQPWFEDENISIPALLRHARPTYGTAIRQALAEVGCEDMPRNGIYTIGAIARNGSPLSDVIHALGLSKQAAGQLVDTLVLRGYLERTADPDDRRRLTVNLTERGKLAALTSRAAVEDVDGELLARVGAQRLVAFRAVLGALNDPEWVFEPYGGPDPMATVPHNRSVPTSVIIPHVVYANVAQAIEWLRATFGFVEHFRYGVEDDSVSGAQLHLGEAWIMLASARPGQASPRQLGGISQSLTLFVPDVDAHFEASCSAGATIVEEVNEPIYGERQYVAEDPEGHRWIFSSHLHDISPEEWGAIVAPST